VGKGKGVEKARAEKVVKPRGPTGAGKPQRVKKAE
jgi:hypothetical protein